MALNQGLHTTYVTTTEKISKNGLKISSWERFPFLRDVSGQTLSFRWRSGEAAGSTAHGDSDAQDADGLFWGWRAPRPGSHVFHPTSRAGRPRLPPAATCEGQASL